MSTPTNPPVKLKSSKRNWKCPQKWGFKGGGGEGELPRYIHKLQVWTTNQLYFWSVEKTVIVLTDEPGVVDGFLCQGLDVCSCTDDADVVFSGGFVVEGYVLADEHSDANAGHVKSV